ncbi:MAG: YdcF family protein [Clostridia bacterium]|nr:YdcF family protein [Clostridia bacterium]
MLGLVLLGNAGYLWLVSNYNLGLLLTTILGGFLVIYPLIYRWIHPLFENPFGAFIRVCLVIGAAAFLFIATLITVSGRNDTVTYKEDAVIILGAGIHGETVSQALAYRLDAALMYHKMNPDALLVVSGGQGPQEQITEAKAMERYLVSRGAAPEKIVREEKATSTFQNFQFSKELLDQRFTTPYKTAYITNSFHVFRAGRIAKNAGIISARFHAQNAILTVIPDYLRECCAIIKFWFCGA